MIPIAMTAQRLSQVSRTMFLIAGCVLMVYAIPLGLPTLAALKSGIEQPARIVAARSGTAGGKSVFYGIVEFTLLDGRTYRAETESQFGHPCKDSDCDSNPVSTTVFYDPRSPSNFIVGNRFEVVARLLGPFAAGIAAICIGLLGRAPILRIGMSSGAH